MDERSHPGSALHSGAHAESQMFQLFAVCFLASTALMVGFTLFLGYLNWRDNRDEEAAEARRAAEEMPPAAAAAAPAA